MEILVKKPNVVPAQAGTTLIIVALSFALAISVAILLTSEATLEAVWRGSIKCPNVGQVRNTVPSRGLT